MPADSSRVSFGIVGKARRAGRHSHAFLHGELYGPFGRDTRVSRSHQRSRLAVTTAPGGSGSGAAQYCRLVYQFRSVIMPADPGRLASRAMLNSQPAV